MGEKGPNISEIGSLRITELPLSLSGKEEDGNRQNPDHNRIQNDGRFDLSDPIPKNISAFGARPCNGRTHTPYDLLLPSQSVGTLQYERREGVSLRRTDTLPSYYWSVTEKQ